MTPVLSKATRADVSVVLALLREHALPELGVAEAIEGFVLARRDGEVVGCAGLEAYAERGLLRSVAVRATAQRSGLGRELVAGLIATAQSRGWCELYLLTTTAAGFFEGMGFEAVPRATVPPEIAESWEFREGCPETALVMRLVLETKLDGDPK